MSTVRRGREAEPEKNWEDEYKRLQEKFIAQKQLCNEQEEHIKMLHVKTRKIERSFAVLERQQKGDGKALARNLEEENLIANLYEQINKLEGQNSELTKKNKHMAELLDKRKKQISTLERQLNDFKRKNPNRTGGAREPRPKSAPVEVDIVPARTSRQQQPQQESSKADENATTNTNLLELAKSYKARLEVAEQQLASAQADNARLREGNMKISGALPVSGGNEDLATQLRDTKWRLQQMETQYNHATSKSTAQMEAFKLAEEQLEEQTKRVRELRSALEALRHDKELTDIKAARVEDLEETVIELRQANRALEDKISRLCEAPFISDAFGQHEARMEFEKVLLERQDYVAKVDHLQEAVKTQYSALMSLKQQAAKLREEKEEAEKLCDELRAKYSELEAGTNLLQDKLRLYSGEDGVNIEDLERALTVVKRRSEAIGKLDFLEDADGFQDITPSALSKKAQEIQMVNLNLTKEVERLENMLRLQTNINRDLHKELESLVLKRDKDKRDLEQKAEDFEELAMKRLNKIHSLEAQLRELVYGMAKKGKGKPVKDDNLLGNHARLGDTLDTVSEVDTENLLLSELLEEKNGEIDPDENMMEVWVKGAAIRDGIVHPGSSTFVVVDFFDYESQTTSILPGSNPKWDFAATYKISVDDFLLRYLATDVITFELNLATQGDFTLLARCTCPLSGLLRAKPLLRLEKQHMISPRTGEIVADLQVDIRLALPLTELYRLFLERHPDERKYIEERSTRLAIETTNEIEKAKLADALAVASLDDESRMYNELEVVVFNVKGLPKSHDGTAPTPYVHFQLLGHPDKFTRTIANTCDPVFNERFSFPMLTNDQQCRLMRRSSLVLSVIDMKAEESRDDDDEGLMGEVNVSLAPLAQGIAVNSTFTMKNSSSDHTGVIRLSIRWKNKFRPQRELGPRALTALEVECLISSFSPGDEKEGIVDYNMFLRFVDPPLSVRRAMENVQAYIKRITEKDGFSAREIIESTTESSEKIDEELFVRCFLGLNIDVLPNEWEQLFRYIDISDNGSVTVDQIMAVLNLDEVAGIPPSLQEKMILQAKNLSTRGVDTKRIFEQADQWGDRGFVTRLEFKSCLRKMGFQLVDEPEPDDEEEMAKSRVPRQQDIGLDDDPLNETFESGEVLVPTSGLGNISESVLVQKEIFERKLAEIKEQRNKGFVAASTPRQENDSLESERDAPGGDTKSVIGKNILDHGADDDNERLRSQLEDVGYSDVEHQSSLHKPDTRIGYDKHVLDSSATKLQSRFRGYVTRKNFKDSPLDRNSEGYRLFDDGPGESEIAPQGTHTPKQIGILQAEENLRRALQSFQGVQPMPNFLGVFSKVDAKKSGYVNRKQFAFSLSQFDSLKIPPEELRVFMDYFDHSNDGTRIDYNAFVRFCNYKPLELLPAVKHLKRMVLRPDSILHFRNLDTAGTGFLSRQEMLKVLSDIGYGHFSHKQALDMLALFETRLEGHVNYSNFVEFVRDNELSRSYDELCEKFKAVILNSGGPEEGSLRRWYRKIDKEGMGSISLESLEEFLAECDLQNYPKLVRAAAYASMNIGGTAIPFQDFCSWVTSPVDLHPALYFSLTTAELQKKANLYLLNIAAFKDASLEELTQSYLIYDWKSPRSGTVSKAEFIRASKQAGFPFTFSELRSIASDFVSHDNPSRVYYKKFLSWAAPSTRQASVDAQATLAGITHVSTQKRAAAMLRMLEECIERGTDLQSIFGRYDQQGTGRVTCGEFCSALSDVGLSSASQKDAMELADRFKAVAGDFILYRRIISELLNQVDVKTGAADIDIVDAVKVAIRRSDARVDRLRDAFSYYDRKGTGRVREEDLGTIFEEARIRLKRHELDSFADKFSIGPSGWIQYIPFLAALESRMGGGPGTQVSRIVAGVPDDCAKKVSWLLETLILKGRDFRAELDSFDDKFTGSILQADFRDVIQERFRAGFSARDLEILETAYRDASDPRRVNFVKMLQELHPRTLDSASPELLHIMQVAENLRSKIRKRCDYLTPGELKRPFRHFARKKFDAGFSLDELSIGVKDLGIKLSGDQERDLFRLMSLDGGRTIRYNHFVVFVCDPHHDDIIWKLRRSISRAHVAEAEVIDALSDADSNDSGLITFKQFAKALKSCNIDMSESDMMRLMLRFDNEDAQRFDIELFGRFLTGDLGEGEEVSRRRSRSRKSLDIGSDSDREGSTRQSQEAAETRLLSQLRRRVKDKVAAGYTPSEVFALFDEDDKGVVDIMALMRGGRKVGVMMTRAEARTVLRRLSLLAGGVVDKVSFFDALDMDFDPRKRQSLRKDRYDDDEFLDISPRDLGMDRGRDSRLSRISGSRRGDYTDDERDEIPPGLARILKSVQNALDLDADDLDRTKSLRSALDAEDGDRDGYVSRKEFISALASIDDSLSRRELTKLFDYLDITGYDDGSVNVKSAVKFLAGKPRTSSRSREKDDSVHRSRSRDAVSGVFRKKPYLMDELSKMAAKLESKGRSLNSLLKDFRNADRRSDGQIEKIDFADCLRIYGFTLPKDIERDLLDSLCHASESRTIDYTSFVDALKASLRAEEDIDEILQSLKRKISRRMKDGRELTDIFNQMDTNGSGKVSLDELKDGLSKLGIDVTRDEAERINYRFSSRGGSIRFRDFVRVLAPGGTSGVSEDDYVTHLVERIRTMLKDRFGSESLSIQRVKSVFADIDVNGDGRLSLREFRNAMAALKVDLNPEDVQQIFARFDIENTGKLRYKDFVDLIGGVGVLSKPRHRDSNGGSRSPRRSLDRQGSVDISGVVKTIRNRLEESFGGGRSAGRRVKEAFEEADTDNNHYIDKREFKQAMRHLKIDLTLDEVREIFLKFDRSGDGRFDYSEFLDLLDLGSGGSRSPRRSLDRQGSVDISGVVKTIRNRLEESFGGGRIAGRRVKEAFEEADTDNNHYIDKREFKQAMRHLKIDLTLDEVREIFLKFDRSGDGRFDYSEFLDLLDLGSGGSRSPRRSLDRQGSVDISGVVKTIRNRLEESFGGGRIAGRRVKEAFEEADTDNNHYIDKREFKQAMRHLKIDLTLDEVREIFLKFDRSGDGRFDYSEFLDLLDLGSGGSRSPRRSLDRQGSVDISGVVKTIRNRLEESFGGGRSAGRRVKEAFEEADTDNNHYIDKREFKQAMRHLKIDLTLDEVREIFLKFDRSGDGRFDYSEFLDLLGFEKPSGSSMRSSGRRSLGRY